MGHPVTLSAQVPPGVEAAARPLCNDLDWLLKQAYYAMASETHRAIEPLGVSPRGYHVLEAALLAERTQSEIADMVALDKTTMVVTMDELEASGLAERRPAERDRRVRVITVTPAGQALVLQARDAVAAVQGDVLSSLGGDRGAGLLDGLRDLVDTRLAAPVACTPPQRRRQPRRSA